MGGVVLSRAGRAKLFATNVQQMKDESQGQETFRERWRGRILVKDHRHSGGTTSPLR